MNSRLFKSVSHVLIHGCVAAVLALLPTQRCPGADPSFADEVDRLVQPYLDDSVVVGMVVGAVRGEETLVRGYGRLRPDDPAKPDGSTIYEIGSVTNPFDR